ncbi:hypothetical protein L208DRAFT_652369 [Tricholoma matsutake]|nr:hypothetical protein L208DRAFT_652369 [Tricholoma matsutake 945]
MPQLNLRISPKNQAGRILPPKSPVCLTFHPIVLVLLSLRKRSQLLSAAKTNFKVSISTSLPKYSISSCRTHWILIASALFSASLVLTHVILIDVSFVSPSHLPMYLNCIRFHCIRPHTPLAFDSQRLH